MNKYTLRFKEKELEKEYFNSEQRHSKKFLYFFLLLLAIINLSTSIKYFTDGKNHYLNNFSESLSRGNLFS